MAIVWESNEEKSGSEVEVKISLPPPKMTLHKGVSEDLVEVEVNFTKKFRVNVGLRLLESQHRSVVDLMRRRHI